MSMPTLFVSHGSPTLILEDLPARAFLASLGQQVPRPKAIVAVSAHWNTDKPAVSTAARPETVHDFYGFPDALYRLHYAAPGAPELAERVAELTGAVRVPGQGLDHGAWVLAMLGWPEADIPIFQLSVQPHQSPAHHIAACPGFDHAGRAEFLEHGRRVGGMLEVNLLLRRRYGQNKSLDVGHGASSLLT